MTYENSHSIALISYRDIYR